MITQAEYDRHAKGLMGSAIKLFRIFVTQECIDKGIRNDPEQNPVALAIKFKCKENDLKVTENKAYIRGFCFRLDPHIYMFMKHWNEGRPVKPVEFVMEFCLFRFPETPADGVFNQDNPSGYRGDNCYVWKSDIKDY
jgi:hypothetical protein